MLSTQKDLGRFSSNYKDYTTQEDEQHRYQKCLQGHWLNKLCPLMPPPNTRIKYLLAHGLIRETTQSSPEGVSEALSQRLTKDSDWKWSEEKLCTKQGEPQMWQGPINNEMAIFPVLPSLSVKALL